MLKKTLFILLSLSLILPIFSSSAQAAVNPNASLSLAPNRKFVYLTFSGLKNVSRVSYTLTYVTGSRTTGVEGGFRTSTRSSRSVRKQILGTCSTRACVYHPSPHNFQLEVTFTLRSGGTYSVSKSLP